MPAEPARSEPRAPGRVRRPTRTAAFGSGRRESHDASDFYGRFVDPEISADHDVRPPEVLDQIILGDARELLATNEFVADGSVALLVTSPPYFAGKDYEVAIGTGHIPGSYKEYLAMLREVFAYGANKLEPGGRMAVNVANLGRKPYRSLAADVITILQDDLRLLLRGEIVWQKALGAGGSVAWGSFQSAANPVLRDVTERVIVASKGRFDRAIDRPTRAKRGLPHEVSIDVDRFMEATTDVWEIAPESATRVGHPAPYPVELPATLIDLYTYVGDLVLDPFMGSGTTAVAAVERRRHYVGFDTDAAYIAAAEERIAGAQARATAPLRVRVPVVGDAATTLAPRALATREGKKAKDIAAQVLGEVGFASVEPNVKLGTGMVIDFVCTDPTGGVWYVDFSGTSSSIRAGLRRTDAIWKSLGRSALVERPGASTDPRWLVLTTDSVPAAGPAWKALQQGRKLGLVHDALDVFQEATVERLKLYAAGDAAARLPFFPKDQP